MGISGSITILSQPAMRKTEKARGFYQSTTEKLPTRSDWLPRQSNAPDSQPEVYGSTRSNQLRCAFASFNLTRAVHTFLETSFPKETSSDALLLPSISVVQCTRFQRPLFPRKRNSPGAAVQKISVPDGASDIQQSSTKIIRQN